MTISFIENEDGTVTLSSSSESEIQVLNDEISLSAYNVQDTSADVSTILSPEFNILWDSIGSRYYENGLDRGVLYMMDGTAVPWNGLLEVKEDSNHETSSVYYDGMQINELVNPGEFSGTISAITYPDELVLLEGMAEVVAGLYLGSQKASPFHLSYRTKIGNDVNEDLGYKIHILYNVFAVPNDRTYSTITDDPEASTFDWKIVALPEEISGYKPTAHVILDSRKLDPEVLAEYEYILYGSTIADAAIIPLVDFVNSLYYGYKWKIIDNGDGTWVAINPTEDLIDIDPVDPDKYTLNDIDADYLSTDIYQITDTFL
jgi:hypothetical protein